MRSWQVATLFMLVGCNKLLDLEHVEPPGSSHDDGGGIDTPDGSSEMPDAFDCTSLVYDEDGDSIDDRCDPCPADVATGNDTDGDGLPDECDPDVGATGDRILFAAMFGDPADSDRFALVNVTPAGSPPGSMRLAASASLKTLQAFAATLVDVRVHSFTGPLTGEVNLFDGSSLRCRVLASNCSTSPGVCVNIIPGGGGGGNTTSPANLERIRFGAGDSGGFYPTTSSSRCEVRAPNLASGPSSTALFNERFAVTTNADATISVDSIIIYGAK